MKLYLHHLAGLPIVRNNVADPFTAVDGRAALRPETAASGIELCDRPEDADLCGLPSHWHIYTVDQRYEVLQFFQRMKDAGRIVLVWVNGDQEIDFTFPNLLVFQHAVRRSRRRAYQVRIYPGFVEDPLEQFDGDLAVRSKGARPVVGFCGQARPVLVDEAKRYAFKAINRVSHALRRTESVPEPWASHVLLRRRVLEALAGDSRVDANFILRDRYRAGLKSKEDRRNLAHPTALQFFENIRSSDFTVCVRGGGNFSIRLYETVSLGRFPLMVDTDDLLPWPEHAFWSTVAVQGSARDLSGLATSMVDRHGSLSEEAFMDMQREARRFWQGRLSLGGYFSHFREVCETALLQPGR